MLLNCTCSQQIFIKVINGYSLVLMAGADLFPFNNFTNKILPFSVPGMHMKSLVLASPSLIQLILDRKRAIVRLRDARAKVCFFRLFLSQTSSWESWRLSWAISNWWRISLAKASWKLTWPIDLSLQLCRPLVTALNFLFRDEKGHRPVGLTSRLKRQLPGNHRV